LAVTMLPSTVTPGPVQVAPHASMVRARFQPRSHRGLGARRRIQGWRWGRDETGAGPAGVDEPGSLRSRVSREGSPRSGSFNEQQGGLGLGQRRRWSWRDHYSPAAQSGRNGFLRLTPVPAKSAVFLVTTVKPLVSAMAATCLSISCSGCGTRSRPQT